ncbi:hypothetical protein [Psychroflexus salis]|uniref:Uncharacterized protein n=1 Tax=Psychroflexus salis TaxID=1526574 RepID=A0A917EBA1_9FLAO|nr:hypothetical protein [Psychroflexus salis]GGE16801.1 hypothetical protein GCM10010831_17630 [Psychroflexus salis]
MFKSLFIQNLTTELLKGIKRAKFSIQLVLEEEELIKISSELIEISKKDYELELIVTSETSTKSIKTTNLLKRLVDAGVDVYWLIDDAEKEQTKSFGIIDKSYLIVKGNKLEFTSGEEVLNKFINELNFLQKKSEQISLFEGDILAHFETDKPFIYSNESIKLNWKVSNAHSVIINPNLGEVLSQGEHLLKINENTMFELIAKNNNSIIKRNIFVRVIKDSFVTYTVEVLDPIINDYVALTYQNNKHNEIGVYNGQELKISWECNFKGELFERNWGLLPAKGVHKCICNEDLVFKFNFQSITKNEITSFKFIRFESVMQKSKSPSSKNIKSKNLVRLFLKQLTSSIKKINGNEAKD